MIERSGVRIADTAIVHDDAVLGPGCQVWHHTQIREGAWLGRDCIVGKDVYIDAGVALGDSCKVQNGAQLYAGATLEDGVFVGPGVIFTNDRVPRAITAEGELKSADDWVVGQTLVRSGASLGAGSTVVTGVTIGRFAMIGAGSVVTADVADHALVVGVPARRIGWVCACGERLVDLAGLVGPSNGEVGLIEASGPEATLRCDSCDRRYVPNPEPNSTSIQDPSSTSDTRP